VDRFFLLLGLVINWAQETAFFFRLIFCNRFVFPASLKISSQNSISFIDVLAAVV